MNIYSYIQLLLAKFNEKQLPLALGHMQIAVGSLQFAVGSWQFAVGCWQFAYSR